ncbi:MAG: (d)CMP kinase [Burkholderiaceae bacterium]|nr:(d)CMP kinase [Burkholderiaceae bacterium]
MIAIDGPTASGKGTVAERVAAALGWNYLDSGSLYRLAALRTLRSGVDPHDADAVVAVAGSIAPTFSGGRIVLEGEDVSDAIRAEGVGALASQIAVIPALRAALAGLQRAQRRAPGLVADGRDMGTVIFPDADLKVFLTASADSRARRRHKQLIEKGFSATVPDLLRDLRERDARDMRRESAPLRPAEGALVLDSTYLTIDQTVAAVLEAHRRNPGAGARRAGTKPGTTGRA